MGGINTYQVDGETIGSVELKCLVVSRGVKVDKAVYRRFTKTHRLSVSPLACNCFALSDGTLVQLTDMGFHLQYLTGLLSWDNVKLLRYAGELGTPFTVRMEGEDPVLCHNGRALDRISFLPYTGFYKEKTSSGLPYMGNAVLQGRDWVAFQCLWPCEFAASGSPCQFCFSGASFETLAQKGRPQPPPVPPQDMGEIVGFAFREAGCSSIQITGGSTFLGAAEAAHIRGYLRAVEASVGRMKGEGELLLYITPPEEDARLDEYFSMGASRVACSLEVWDEKLAAAVTPGKLRFTGRARYLSALAYAAERYGPGKAFSNFIIGLEPFETLREGCLYLARRGVIPSASIWMPMGRPVQGSMKPPDVAYYRRVKDMLAELYTRYNLQPAGCCGLNVCMERDIYRWAKGPGCGCAAGEACP